MKKNYSKPQIIVEAFTMDQPIAANCTVPKYDMEALKKFGCFSDGRGCTYDIMDGGGFDFDGDGVAEYGHDTVCYHSNMSNVFWS